MSTTIDNQNPINLSKEQNLIKEHNGLDGMPGHVVVVFEKLKHGGAKFSKTVDQTQRFKNFVPLLDSPQNYFAVAVNDSILKYSFEVLVTLDDDIHQFALIFHLTYRAANPRRLAELQAQDPLGLLCNMIAQALSRACRNRKLDMVKHRFRELERIVLDNERA